MTLKNAKRMIIFGGTFDPPHVGHLVLPTLVAEAVNADVVVYIPAGQSPHKQGQTHTSAQHRLAMIKLATAHLLHAHVLDDEINRTPSYTVDTLTALRQQLGQRVQMRLLIGADQMKVFDTWRQPQRIIELAEPLVMLRPPDTRAALLQGVDPSWSQRFIELPQLDISSTAIRTRVANGRSVVGWLPSAVIDYITKHGLYRDVPA